MIAARRTRLADDEGSILPLIAVFAALALALILVIACATSLYLARKRLYSVADAAALAGAESFSIDRTASGSTGPAVALDPDDVARAAADEVSRSSGDDLVDLRIVRAGTPDGRTASVTLAAEWRPPLLAPFVPNGVPIEVTTTARSVFR